MVGPWIRVEKDTFIEKLREAKLNQNNELTPRQLVSIVLDSLHKITRSLIVNNTIVSKHPSNIYFEATDGLVAKHFHTHPLLLTQTGNEVLGDGTLDSQGFLESTGYGPDDVLYSDDSDRCLWFVELSGDEHQLTFHVHDQRLTPKSVASWAKLKTDNLQRTMFFQKNFKFHSKEIHNSWDPVLAEADRFYDDVLVQISNE